MRIEKIIKKYLMILCLSYTVTTLVFTGIAFWDGATVMSIWFNFWSFIFCLLITIIMAIFDRFYFDNIIVELILRFASVLVVCFGGAVFIFGIVQKPIGMISMVLIQTILFGVFYLLFYAKERRDAEEINDKLKRNN